jgi:hypothetical protein
MKKILLLLLSITASPIIYAQVSLGIRGGFNLSAMKFESEAGQKSGGIYSGNQLKNLQADLLLNVPLYGGLHLQPSFRYVTKGTLFDPVNAQQSSVSFGEVGNRIRVRYIEMPVNLVYKFMLSGCKLVLGGGPYAAYGLTGNYHTDIILNGKVVSHNNHSLAFDNTDNVVLPGMYLNRWDAGINTTVGIELNNLVMIGINYSIGMVDLDNSPAYKVKNSSAGISVGILFNREDY